MKYMMMVKTDRNSETGRNYETGVPPDSKLMAAIGKHAEEMIKAGVLLETGGLLPITKGARVRAVGGKLTVTDGPFHRVEGSDRRLRHPSGEVEGRSDRCSRASV